MSNQNRDNEDMFSSREENLSLQEKNLSVIQKIEQSAQDIPQIAGINQKRIMFEDVPINEINNRLNQFADESYAFSDLSNGISNQNGKLDKLKPQTQRVLTSVQIQSGAFGLSDNSPSQMKLNQQMQQDNIRASLNFQSQTLKNFKKLDPFHLYQLTKEFIQQLKQSSDSHRFKLINLKIFKTISDLSSDFEVIFKSSKNQLKQNNQKSFLSYFKFKIVGIADAIGQCYQFFDQKIDVIQPDSKFKIFWDTMLILIIIINIFYIPMKLSFKIESIDTTQIFVETLPSILFILEIILNFNTAFYKRGRFQSVMYTSRKDIFKNYITGNFRLDLIAVIPFIISKFDIPYTDFALLLRVTRIKSMVENLEDIVNLKDSLQAIFDLFKLIYFVIFTAHFCACGWHFLGIVEVEQWNLQKSWLLQYNIYEEDWISRYIYSFYWSTITCLTIGYGDVIPSTNGERIYVILVALIICGVFGYTITYIGSIFTKLQEKNVEYRKKLKIINQHMKKRGLNKQLQLKVRKYFEYYFQLQQKDDDIEAEQMMAQLTKSLNEEVYVDIYKKILLRSRFMQDIPNQETIRKLCMVVKEKKVAPDELIFSQQETASKLFFVMKGSIGIFADLQNNQNIIKQFNVGSVIGEREFLKSDQHFYSAKALKFTQLAYIEFDDLIKIIQSNRNELEKFCHLRDNLIFNSSNFGHKCEVCNWKHQLSKCPCVFIQINEGKLAKEFQKQIEQDRSEFNRKRKKKNILKQLKSQRDLAMEYILANDILKENDVTEQLIEDLGFSLKEFNCVDQSISDGVLFSPTNKNPSQESKFSKVNKPHNNYQFIKEKKLVENEDNSIQRNNSIGEQFIVIIIIKVGSQLKNTSKNLNQIESSQSSQSEAVEAVSIKKKQEGNIHRRVSNFFKQINLQKITKRGEHEQDSNTMVQARENFPNAQQFESHEIQRYQKIMIQLLVSSKVQYQKETIPPKKSVFNNQEDNVHNHAKLLFDEFDQFVKRMNMQHITLDIDKMQDSNIYFTGYNIESVISQMKQKQMRSKLMKFSFRNKTIIKNDASFKQLPFRQTTMRQGNPRQQQRRQTQNNKNRYSSFRL